MVLFMHQLQLIGIKTNLESFVTTTLMEHMLNRHQLHLFLWVSKQWGYSTGGSGAWALKFNGVYTAVVVGAPGFPAREFCGFTFDYTLTGWSFAAGYNSPVSYIRPTTTAISLGYWTVGILLCPNVFNNFPSSVYWYKLCTNGSNILQFHRSWYRRLSLFHQIANRRSLQSLIPAILDSHRFLSAQWGINTGGAVRTSTLPIPFTNVFLAVASTSSEWWCPGCSATNTTVTTRAYQSNRPDVAQPNDVNWIIIGC